MRSIAIRFVPAILDPFGGVSSSIGEPECVRLERTCRKRASYRRGPAVFAIRVTRACFATPRERGRRPCAGRIFPLCLAGETILLARLLREPFEKCLGVV